jgi:hypothetical protein
MKSLAAAKAAKAALASLLGTVSMPIGGRGIRCCAHTVAPPKANDLDKKRALPHSCLVGGNIPPQMGL